MINALKGACLGLLDGIAITIAITPGMGGFDGKWFVQALGIIGVLACVMAVPCGAVLGWFAGRLRTNRVLVLELVALGLVPLCGIAAITAVHPARVHAYELLDLVMIATGPTVLGVLVLERWTRPRYETARALTLRSAAA